jgi:orotidine-5'-phosphate decarboxylase
MHSDSQPAAFADRLAGAVRARHTPVLVGLDPRIEQLPAGLQPGAGADWQAQANAYRSFCLGVIDVVAPLVAAVKPQAAFFEQLGPAGMAALKDVMDYASARGLLVILDGKRNDIGTTATAYAAGYLGGRHGVAAGISSSSPKGDFGANNRSRAKAPGVPTH